MRVTITALKEKKQKGEKITMLTAYDYMTAKMLDEAGIDILLVGDSLGMVVLGYESTLPVTLDEVLHHAKAVTRGAKQALVIGDMPFMTYQAGVSEAMHNAARFMKEAGTQAIKLEGGRPMAGTVARLVESGIPVMGHLGLTPQSIHQFGGFKVQGKSVEAAKGLLADALALQEAGAFAILLECVPTALAKLITQRLSIPILGIGAGLYCDGQVQVVGDVLGLCPDFVPKHAKQYVQFAQMMKEVATTFIGEVNEGQFPTPKQSFTMDERILEELD